MMEPTQNWEREDLAALGILWHGPGLWLWSLLFDALMRPSMVEVLDIGVKYAVELLLLQDEHVIKALSTHTSQKPFTDGIRSRSLIWYPEYLDVTCFCNPREAYPKLAVIITDEILRLYTKGGSFPKLLRSPSVSGISCHTDMDYFSRVQFDEEEGIEGPEKQVGNCEKVTGPDLLGMSV
jgi:hypothetical protein